MSDQETIAAFRATIERRIPEYQAVILKIENNPDFSKEYKTTQVVLWKKEITTAEQELIGFDNLILSIIKSYA